MGSLPRTLVLAEVVHHLGWDGIRDVIAYDIRALLLIVLVAAILGIAGANVVGVRRGFHPRLVRGDHSAAIAALLTAFLTTDASLYNALLGGRAGGELRPVRRLDRGPVTAGRPAARSVAA